MPGPLHDPDPFSAKGTRYAALILGAWSLCIAALGGLALLHEDGLATRVRLLAWDGPTLSVPTWALLLATLWLLGLVVIALAAQAGNAALRARLQSLQVLREAEARFRLFMNHLPGVAFVKDADGRYVFASESFATYFGLKPAEVIGKTDHDLWPADAARFRADDQRVLRAGEPSQILEETSFGPQPASWLTLKFPLPQPDGPTHLGGLSIDIIAQRRTERELLESQRRHATLLRNLPGMAYRARADDQRTLEFCSGGATELTGFSPDELIGNHRASYGHLIHPEDRERVARVVQNATRNGVPFRLTYRIVTRHGAERHVWEQGRPVPGDGEQGPALEGFVTDVTDRKRAEAEVERRSAEFRMLFERAPMSIWLEDFSIARRRVLSLRESGVTDVRAWFLAHPDEASRLAASVRLLDVNQATLNEFLGGKHRETLIDPGTSLRPGALAMFVEMLAATADDLPFVKFEGQTDVIPRDVLVAFSVVPGHEADYSRVLVSLLDVTAVKRGEALLASAEKRFRALFEQAPSAILVFDADTGRVVSANPAAEALLGASAAEIARVTFHDLFVDDAPDADGRLQRVVRTDGQQFEVRLRSLEGEPRDALMNLRRVEYAGGRMLQAVCQDITGLKAVERRLTETVRQLESSNADLRQLAWFVSHDFSEPLRTITGFVQLLGDRAEAPLDERAREYVRQALEGAGRMERMIDALLAYARASTSELTPLPVDPTDALTNALRNLQLALTSAEADVVHDRLPPVLGDENLLTLLFQNLLSNALRYRSEAPPRVEVRGVRVGDRVRLLVRDNGVGIAPEQRERVFQMFQRLGASGAVPGAGIGLAICRRLVQRLGGTIRVEPTEGPGATFAIELPAAP